MAKLIIKKNNLPIIDSEIQQYFVRYRIVSDDRNKFSYWSPIFVLNMEPYSAVSGSINSSGDIININWDLVSGIQSYDIWVNWKYETTEIGWQYQGRYINNNVTIIKPSHSPSYDAVSIRIYVKTDPIPDPADLSDISNYLIYENLSVAI